MKESFFEEMGIDFLEIKKKETCEKCGLYKNCISPKMEPSGRGRKKILLIGEAPEKVEDEENTQFISRSGQLLRRTIEEAGLFLDRDFRKTNAVRCRPPNNRTPYTKEINICRKYIYKEIKEYKPKVIILTGAIALQSLLGQRITGRIEKVPFSDWAGECIPDQELKLWICPVFHPAYIMRNDADPVLLKIWKKQIEKAISMINIPIYIHNYESDVIIMTEENEVCTFIENMMITTNSLLSFDYETTGKKPHREGQRIISVSISDGIYAWSFPFFSESERFIQLWKKFLSSNTKKIAHYASFERLWSIEKINTDIEGQLWDTALIQHILRNDKNKQLKFWSYVKFGILGYDDNLHSFISKAKENEDEKSANAFNRLDEASKKEVLHYGGLDSLLTHKLQQEQSSELINNKNYIKAYELFIEGDEYLVKCSQNGIRLNLEEMEKQKIRIKRKLEKLHLDIMESKEIQEWDRIKPFNYNSIKDIKHLLFDLMNIHHFILTKTGNPAVNKEALEKMNLRITNRILEYRRWNKALNTYIAQYSREQINGILHPFFHLSTVTTYRSSSSRPNFQNIPKQDKEIKQILRSFIIPRKGNRLTSYDFKQMEVCVAACYNQDPNLIAYIKDTTKDMHRDMAALLFMKNKEEITKEERQEVKNKFVFPAFYGSYYEQMAPDLWENIPKYTKVHLKEKGIKNLFAFIEHVHYIENYLWESLFPVYADWKVKTYKEYQKKGYIDFYTGFRCWGPMKKNEAINYRIQGTAFHILLWTLIQVMKRTESNKRSYIIGQIHDDIEGDIHPDDEEEFDYLVWLYATQKVREHWDWINVPLRVEKERSEIDGNWAEMKDCGFLDFSKKGN